MKSSLVLRLLPILFVAVACGRAATDTETDNESDRTSNAASGPMARKPAAIELVSDTLVAENLACDPAVTNAYVVVIQRCQGFTNDTQVRTCKAAAEKFLGLYPNESCTGRHPQTGQEVRVASDSVRLVLQRLKELGY